MNDDFVELPDIDENEITEEEILQYADWLGMDPDEDKDLLWIAKEAFLAKVPPPWKQYQKKDGPGDPFYFNTVTGESTYEHPLDAHYKEVYLREKAKLQKQSKTNEEKPKQNTPFIIEEYEYVEEEEEEEEKKPKIQETPANDFDQFVHSDSDSDSIPRLRNKPANNTQPKTINTNTTATTIVAASQCEH